MDQFTDFLNKDPLNYNSVVTRVKILSKLDIAERRVLKMVEQLSNMVTRKWISGYPSCLQKIMKEL